MAVVLKQGGLAPGGFNFDAKLCGCARLASHSSCKKRDFIPKQGKRHSPSPMQKDSSSPGEPILPWRQAMAVHSNIRAGCEIRTEDSNRRFEQKIGTSEPNRAARELALPW